MSSIDYVADHIDRIERRHGGNQNLIVNSKWRIASSVDLFPEGTLSVDGTLTPDQITQLDAYIAKFKATSAGREAIANYARRAS
jgi:hypothetical protein